MDVVLIIAWNHYADCGCTKAGKDIADKLIIPLLPFGKRFAKVGHDVIESIIEHLFKSELALLVLPYLLNRSLQFFIKIVIGLIGVDIQHLIDTADMTKM